MLVYIPIHFISPSWNDDDSKWMRKEKWLNWNRERRNKAKQPKMSDLRNVLLIFLLLLLLIFISFYHLIRFDRINFRQVLSFPKIIILISSPSFFLSLSSLLLLLLLRLLLLLEELLLDHINKKDVALFINIYICCCFLIYFNSPLI